MSTTKRAKQIMDAVYGNGMLRVPYPHEVPFAEGQRVRLTVEPVGSPQSGVELLMHLYDGLSEEEIDEIERIILDKRDFFSGRPLL